MEGVNDSYKAKNLTMCDEHLLNVTPLQTKL